MQLTPAFSAVVVWDAWSVGSVAPVVVGSSVTFAVAQEAAPVWTGGARGSKDFYSTSSFNGQTLGSLAGRALQYTITAPAALVSPPGTGLAGPYLNIVVTDGAGGFSFLLLDASSAPLGQQFHAFTTARYAFNENSGASMTAFVTALGAPDAVNNGRDWYDFSDVASLSIATAGLSSNPGAVTPVGGTWSGFGLTDSFLLVLGNRGSTPVPEVTIDAVSLVPEPTSWSLAGVSLMLAWGVSQRRRSSLHTR